MILVNSRLKIFAELSTKTNFLHILRIALALDTRAHRYGLSLGSKNTDSIPIKTVIAVHYPILDHVEFYFFKDDELTKSQISGDRQIYSVREYQGYTGFAASAALKPGEERDVYLKVKSTSSVALPLGLE